MIHRVAVLVLWLSLAHFAVAQGQDTVRVEDLKGWASLELKYKANQKWTLSLAEQLRLGNDMSEVDKYFTQLGARYKAARGVSLGAGYRFIRQNDTKGKIQGYESHRRYHLSATYRHKPQRFSLGYRVRYQSRKEAGFSTSSNHLRIRAQARYNVRDWRLDPVFSTELYRPVGSGTVSEFDKIRFTLGTNYKIGAGEISVFYRFEKELIGDYPEKDHIIGLGYTYNLGTNNDG